jgi:divalent metal cation (Fe/Co/Zn/Cd) transporter
VMRMEALVDTRTEPYRSRVGSEFSTAAVGRLRHRRRPRSIKIDIDINFNKNMNISDRTPRGPF